MRININTAAMTASRSLGNTTASIGKSVEKLSTGYRINKAGDDAAGLVISNRLRAQVSGLRQAIRNAQDGVSVLQTAEGALVEVSTMLQRMRDLSVQASNVATYDTAARTAAQAEIAALRTEITRIGDTTKFGNIALLDGSVSVAASALTFQVGANTASGDSIAITLGAISSTALTLGSIDLASATYASVTDGIGVLDTAISVVSDMRAKLGALSNRFDSLVSNLSVTTENLASSESRIRDTDMAAEMVEFTKNQVLQQAGTAMLAQANQIPQGILALLQG
jgi:flagellin